MEQQLLRRIGVSLLFPQNGFLLALRVDAPHAAVPPPHCSFTSSEVPLPHIIVIMSGLRILVPVKRVIDYAVSFGFCRLVLLLLRSR